MGVGGRKLASVIVVTLFLFSVYMLFTMPTLERLQMEIILGVISSLIVATLLSHLILEKPSKALNIVRWFWAIVYLIYFFFISEVRAHVDVAKRILHPRMPINPGIVAVPYYLKTDYGITAVANSITNTPGTVVIDLERSENGGTYFVHWIYVRTIDREMCRKYISERFEYYIKKVFEG